MFSVLTILIIAWLVSISGYLGTAAYWPFTLFLTWAFALRNLSSTDFRRANGSELYQLILVGIPFYGLISLAIAFAISWIDEHYIGEHASQSGWLGVGLLFVIASLVILNRIDAASNSDASTKRQYKNRLDPLLRSQSEDPFYFVTKLTGISKDVIVSTSRHYDYVDIPKKTGGTRRLSIPNNELKSLQSVLAGFLENTFGSQIHHCCHAYRKDRSIFSNAVPHLGCKVLIKLDIKDYFGSVTKNQVRNIIRLDGGSVGFEVSKNVLKTHVPDLLKTIPDYLEDEGVCNRFLSIFVNEEGLPQGAPSSPILANLLLKDFDQEVQLVVNSMEGRYTRYSDDLTISFKEDDADKIARVIKFVESKLKDYGFRLNKKKGKIQVLRSHQAQRVCGVTINSGRPTISRKQRRLIRAAQHNKALGKEISFTEQQLQGHIGFQSYIQLKGVRLLKKIHANKGKKRVE